MTKNEKAVSVLSDKGIDARVENDTVYVVVNDYSLELAQFEIDFQADEYEEEDCN